MIRWFTLFLYFSFLQASAQYSYTYTDPCTLQSKSVFVPAGGGVVVNYFDNHNIFTSNDFSSGAFDNWIAQVSQQNSNAPCQSVTTAIVNTVSTAVVLNTVSIVTNVVSISSLAQTMASVMTSATGGSLTSTAESISNSNSGGSSDSTNENNSNESTTGNNAGGSSTNANSNKGNSQSEGNKGTVQGSGTNINNEGGTASTGSNQAQGSTSSGDNQAQGGEQETSSSVGGSGSTANSVSNSIDGGSSDGSNNNSSTESSEVKESKSGGGSNLANSLSNAVDGGGSGGGSSSSGGGSNSKKESSAKASTGALIASGDMVVIANADRDQPSQFKFVGSITHANTRGTRIKGVLFNYTTQVNNFNVTFYKSYVNKSKKLNTVIANSTMMNTAKDIFNTTTLLESYKATKKITGMFGINLTGGQLGERKFYNISAVVGGHVPIQVNKRVSTSILVLGIYSPFTQFYEGKWWSAGVLVVPFNSWDLKLTKTFKFNISATAVYSYGQSFLNYQVLTGGKINF